MTELLERQLAAMRKASGLFPEDSSPGGEGGGDASALSSPVISTPYIPPNLAGALWSPDDVPEVSPIPKPSWNPP